jgi:outer membrane protein OmpA-like peptidoglycan-associated protein
MSIFVVRTGAGAVLVAGLLAAGCGGTMTFHGAKAVAIQGTPPAAAPAHSRVNVGANKIEISEKIQFGDNSDKILEASYGLLDELTTVIKANPQITKILIEGHASSEGNAAHNLKLSDERAHSVMDYLEKHGVEKGRLSAKGFGATHPIADNKTEEGREKNRRVDFTIVSQKKK